MLFSGFCLIPSLSVGKKLTQNKALILQKNQTDTDTLMRISDVKC